MIQHVTYYVTPALAEDCAGFYRKLGFRNVPPPLALRDHALWLSRAGSQVHLQFTDSEGREITEIPDRGPGCVGIVVSELKAAVDALEEDGVELEPVDAPSGIKCFQVRDPAGNLLELMQSGL